MQNLKQLRAAKALETAAKTSKAAVSKLPAMILANGLLAACAFASESKKDGQTPRRREMKETLDGAAQHLSNRQLGIAVLDGCKDTGDLIRKLTGADSTHLQRATAEALAFIAYVKHFTTQEGAEENGAE